MTKKPTQGRGRKAPPSPGRRLTPAEYHRRMTLVLRMVLLGMQQSDNPRRKGKTKSWREIAATLWGDPPTRENEYDQRWLQRIYKEHRAGIIEDIAAKIWARLELDDLKRDCRL